jgi:predicted RNase H-like HicB family nuclease
MQAQSARFVLSDYVDEAMRGATYDKLDDDSYAGRIPSCVGVVAFGSTLRECEDTLRSTLEDWILVGLKLGHPLPVLAGIDLNGEPEREPVESL